MRNERGSQAFTLLEVMAAVAILALTLVTLLDIVTRNVRSTVHARMTTVATFLARGKMVTLEDKLIEKGFQDLEEDDDGTFADDGFADFSWESKIEKIELPAEAAMKIQGASGSAATSGDTIGKADPMQALTGMVGGLMGGFMEPIRVGLEESIRRVTLRVFWTERGRPEQSVEVVLYMTDPAKLDVAMALGNAAGLGAGVPNLPGIGTPGGNKPPAPTGPSR